MGFFDKFLKKVPLDIRKMVDWKDFNYLLDKLTVLEDKGYNVYLAACIRMDKVHRPDFEFIYAYCNYENWEDNVSSRNELFGMEYISSYQKNGIYYKVYIHNTKKWQHNLRELEDFFELVKDKYVNIDDQMIYDDGSGNLILKNKNKVTKTDVKK